MSRKVIVSAGAAAVVIGTACSQPKPAEPPKPIVTTKVVHDTVEVRDPDLDKQLAKLQLQLFARDAQIEDLQTRLEDTRAEVVRAMAKLQTVASRAQAASAMAEAEVALQTLRSGGGGQQEAAQVGRLVSQSTAAFDKQNYGGALYLANQAKTLASSFRGRLSATGSEGARAGETTFAVPLQLRTTSKGNIRSGPGTNFPVAFAADAGTGLTAYSFADEWIRVSDGAGRSGWIFRSLVTRP